MEQRFFAAVYHNRMGEVKEILKSCKELEVNWKNENDHGFTALHIATRDGHYEITRILLAHPNIKVNKQADSGDTPYLLACYKAQTKVVKLLLSSAAVDCNLADSAECTPLWWAAFLGHVEVLKWMIASGREFDTSKKGTYGPSTFSAAEIAKRNKNEPVVSLLARLLQNPSKALQEIRAELNVDCEFYVRSCLSLYSQIPLSY